MFVFGENTQTPTFEKPEYSGNIAKSTTPVGISLDCIPDNDFHMVVVDSDYIADSVDNNDINSSNVVKFCEAKKEENSDEYFTCSVEEIVPGVPGRYKIDLTLLKSLTTIPEDAYEFTVHVQVGLKD